MYQERYYETMETEAPFTAGIDLRTHTRLEFHSEAEAIEWANLDRDCRQLVAAWQADAINRIQPFNARL